MRLPGPPCRERGSGKARLVRPRASRPRVVGRRGCRKETGWPPPTSGRSEISHAAKAPKQELPPCSALACPGAAPEREDDKRHLIASHRLVNSRGRGDGAIAPPGNAPGSGGGGGRTPPALLSEGSAAGPQSQDGSAWVWNKAPRLHSPLDERGAPYSHGPLFPESLTTARAPTPSKRPVSGQRHNPIRLLFARLGGRGFQVGNRWEEGFPTSGGVEEQRQGEGGRDRGVPRRLRRRCAGLGPSGKPGTSDPLHGTDPGKRKGRHPGEEITLQLLPQLSSTAERFPSRRRWRLGKSK